MPTHHCRFLSVCHSCASVCVCFDHPLVARERERESHSLCAPVHVRAVYVVGACLFT